MHDLPDHSADADIGAFADWRRRNTGAGVVTTPVTTISAVINPQAYFLPFQSLE